MRQPAQSYMAEIHVQQVSVAHLPAGSSALLSASCADIIASFVAGYHESRARSEHFDHVVACSEQRVEVVRQAAQGQAPGLPACEAQRLQMAVAQLLDDMEEKEAIPDRSAHLRAHRR